MHSFSYICIRNHFLLFIVSEPFHIVSDLHQLDSGSVVAALSAQGLGVGPLLLVNGTGTNYRGSALKDARWGGHHRIKTQCFER
jgi:hypothetical protein